MHSTPRSQLASARNRSGFTLIEPFDRLRVRQAFTLIELLVVIAIIAILAALLVPSLRQARDSAESSGCLYMLRKVGKGLHEYMNDHDFVTPPFSEQYSSSYGSETKPDGNRYHLYRKLWTHTEWWRSGPDQHWFRDGKGFLGPYLASHESADYGVPFCPSAPEGWISFTLGAVEYPVYAERHQSLGVNLHATNIGAGGLGQAGRDFHEFESPSLFITFSDTQGQSAYSKYQDHYSDHPEAYTVFTPTPRHGGAFNAAFLDGHAEPCTLQHHFTADYFTQPVP
jgi:prepilin-type N-terminal cleavage/methylation domain-containing protein/prepilin-type processing-associated H-X9-DG protein